MPKRAASKANGGANKAKIARSKNVIHRQWQANMGRGKWCIYCDVHHSLIETAFESGKDSVKLLNDKGESILIDFVNEKNENTHFSRQIRCAVSTTKDGQFTIWSYKQGRVFKPYPFHIAELLETAANDGKDDLTIDDVKSGNKLTFDLSKSTVLEDNKTVAIKSTVSDVTEYTAAPLDIKDNKKDIVTITKLTQKKKTAAASKVDTKVDVKVKADPDKPADDKLIKTLKIVGKAPVDSYCPLTNAMVYYEGNTVFDVMLNQTNLNNNNNKYFVIQLLKDRTQNVYYNWFRWGRVGLSGQNNLINCGGNLLSAKSAFEKKFQDKTKNYWADRATFKKVVGKYDRVKLDYGANSKNVDEVDSSKKKVKKVASKLNIQVQNIMKLICDVSAMEQVVKEMKFDAKRTPLGKLTKTQIRDGYSALKQIDKFIKANVYDKRLVLACDAFYTRIPHSFGMQRPPVLRTPEQVKQKMDLLNALNDIEEAMKIIEQSMSKENPMDSQYSSLHCGIEPIASSHDEYKLIDEYLQNTHASSHDLYKISLQELFSLDREGEQKAFTDLGNRKLLWHGSRLTNFVGILSQGLRIAPPEAPSTGYMFGKGVYFADMSSKSANYCFPSRTRTTGLLLLCEVSLGNENELLNSDYNANRLPKGKHSVKGLGKTVPDPNLERSIENQMKVPCGKGVDTDNKDKCVLRYNEYIVYDLKQIKMRYLLKINFDFK